MCCCQLSKYDIGNVAKKHQMSSLKKNIFYDATIFYFKLFSVSIEVMQRYYVLHRAHSAFVLIFSAVNTYFLLQQKLSRFVADVIYVTLAFGTDILELTITADFAKGL